ncbi:MAG: helix-turn-helix domain-containing protein [Anaerovoracaceae bacterium]
MNKDYNFDIGEKIKQARKDRNISAEKLASEIGVSPSTIYRYENNDISHMGIDKLKAIATVLNTSASILLGWDNEQTSLNTDELNHLQMYRFLDSHGREIIDLLLKKEYERCISSSKLSSLSSSDNKINISTEEKCDEFLKEYDKNNNKRAL